MSLREYIRDGDIDMVRSMLDKDPSIVNKQFSDKWSPLLYAAYGRHPNIVSLLLERGADINAVDRDRSSVLMTACLSGCRRTISLLLDRGARTDMFDNIGRDLEYYCIVKSTYNFVCSHPRSLYQKIDRSNSYMDMSYSDLSITFSS
jgi:ankyrin repeat protein